MGETGPAETFPEWYLLVQAAKWLGVAPWDLMEKPIWWMHWALAGRVAENKAEKIMTERQTKKSKRR